MDNRIDYVKALLEGKTSEEQVQILMTCFRHAISHPWVDDEVADSIMENIGNEFGMPFISSED